MGTYRHIRAIALTAAAAVTVAAVPVWAAEDTAGTESGAPLVLEPSSGWKAGFTGGSCLLIREFGEGDNAVRLRFNQDAPGLRFNLQASGNPLALTDEPKPLSYQWLPDAYSHGSRTARGGLTGGGIPVIVLDGTFAEATEPLDEDSEPRIIKRPSAVKEYLASRRGTRGPTFGEPRSTDIVALMLDGALARPVKLNFGSGKAALTALKNCQSQIVSSWGFDPVTLGQLTRRAEPDHNPASWVSANDFPPSVLQRGLKKEAKVSFRLRINGKGRVDDCIFVEVSEEEQLNDLTCKLVTKRARFNPALDENGKPTSDFYLSTVRWAMPK